eukprot:gene15279-21361_t
MGELSVFAVVDDNHRLSMHDSARSSVSLMRSSKTSPRQKRREAIDSALRLVTQCIQELNIAKTALCKKGGFFAGVAAALQLIDDDGQYMAEIQMRRAEKTYSRARKLVVLLPELDCAHPGAQRLKGLKEPSAKTGDRATRRECVRLVAEALVTGHLALAQLKDMEAVY